MSMRIIEPKENVEYVFRFPPKKVYTYRWYGDMQKGRILLFNETRKYYTAFTPQYFTFLCRNRLVQKTAMQPTEKPVIEQPAPMAEPAVIENKPKTLKEIESERDRKLNEVTPLDAECIKFLEKIIQKQEALPNKHKNFIKRMYENEPSAWPETIIKNSKTYIEKGCSDVQFSTICGGVNRQEILYQRYKEWFDNNK